MLVAVDLSFAAAIAIAAAEEVACLLEAPLEALHVIDDTLLASDSPLPIDRDGLTRVTLERLDAEVWPLLAKGRARSTRVGPLAEILADAVRRGPAALLVLGTGTAPAGWIDCCSARPPRSSSPDFHRRS